MTAGWDWRHEWFASLTWTGVACVATVAGCAVAVWLVTRYTRWGRQFRRLAFPYFDPLRSRGPLLMVVLMLGLTILTVRLSVLISYALNDVFTALGRLDAQAFWSSIALFAALAACYVAGSLTNYLLAQRFTIHWRTWLTDHMISDWLQGQAYHRSQFVTEPVDNPDQRIQEDVQQFAEQSYSLSMGSVDAALRLVSFTAVLWGLSGPVPVLGFQVPRAMVLLSYVYVLVASLIAFRVGRPLIRLEFLREGLSASFRYALIRLRDHSENIAFYGGERVERAALATRFTAVIANAWTIALRRLKLQGFNDSVTQLAQVFPYVIQAPRFFAGAITLGDVTQTADAFGQVHDSLSFFRNSYDSFAGYRAALDRLTALMDANHDARRLPSPTVADHPGALVIEGLRVWRPDHEPLIEGLTLTMNPGQALLVKGASGSGKTTLLRSMANLWPHAHGTIRRPTGGRTLFLSQQPYLPMGSLRTALAYPEPPQLIEDRAAREMLHKVQLGHLEFRIDEEAHWSRILSPGEQQRLGFARILLNRPHLVFLDEATSAVDEGLEHALYRLIRERLPGCMVVSVGHRSTLNAFHTHHLSLLGAGRWGMAPA
ncbi:ABC transporter ATP-binding protein/permease [Nonomuraea jiangxiensis]|uniref:Putative ATP-binding cassette transporter n=1 Tax=Nonomuraea jiangxiensis TaxID=633440 RepID=A0A1G8D3B0_9ACTN|nr:ABC transporter ATP-binding protein/permease [Nonomuraea jiangxiensis]SDH52307.1 putative ATP-binding cassette transporter [Nonomuraea jiangxiensis]